MKSSTSKVEKVEASQKSPKFKVGQKVDFVNKQGCKFFNKTVVEIEIRDGEFRYFVMPTDSPWFPNHESELSLAAELPAYRVTYEDGTSYVTSMAKGVTLEDARAYFVGQSLTQSDETTKKVKTVEVA